MPPSSFSCAECAAAAPIVAKEEDEDDDDANADREASSRFIRCLLYVYSVYINTRRKKEEKEASLCRTFVLVRSRRVFFLSRTVVCFPRSGLTNKDYPEERLCFKECCFCVVVVN
jgi:hypothetical protein